MLKQDTYLQQKMLASFCRGEELSEELLVRQERVGHYRRLVFNIVLDMMDTMYPVASGLFQYEEWKALIERFFLRYECSDPQVWRMPRFLIDYVKENEPSLTEKYPFLPDLLTIEWKELEWFTNPDQPPIELPSDYFGDGKQYFYHPEHEIILLDYPVFKTVTTQEWTEGKAKYFLLIYRHIDTDKVYYTEVSPFFAFFWESVKEQKPLTNIRNELEELICLNTGENVKVDYLTDTFLKNLIENRLLLVK